jgi:P27 family predicted phage terminase small subunit
MPGVKGRSGGHNAKTVKAHQLAGTFQKTRHKGITNPDPPSGDPVQPKRLTGDAGREWDRMIRRLKESKTLSTVDDGALYQYCRLFGETEGLSDQQASSEKRLKYLEDRLDEMEGEQLTRAIDAMTSLEKVVSGYVTKIRMQRMALRAYLVEFGLTPASRGRVKVADKPDDDPFGDLDDDDDDSTVN